MNLLPGFTQPIELCQQNFRLILKALSEPGVPVGLNGTAGWGRLGATATAVLLTLADGETPVWLSPELIESTAVDNLRFHTGAPLAGSLNSAVFAVFGQEISDAQLRELPCGSEVSPEHSATVLVQLEHLDQGAPLRLRGPGIKTQRVIAPSLPAAVRDYLLEGARRFPLGIDFLLVNADGLLALPRTTFVEES
ncbi:phosphonate C-P lyase system protein PhnH [Acerihabitans sp. TG2]|uniref:phosphonate C-P lyase system protein PhnH n=1 Tax=Acerihabitans sp. TG2 TaxID=3096008 RepID=UPI002B223D75|nr:phosphonate C-P lyase system protein PhnH [Acerihabitans sp. TG2]MEA9389659.1 phosphonate C-P lyase system protein PhnH [Acerihabitans sp. TG2]